MLEHYCIYKQKESNHYTSIQSNPIQVHGNPLLLLLTFSDYTMSSSPVTILIHPPPIFSNNQFPNLFLINHKIPFSSHTFPTLKTSCRKSVRLKKTMAAESEHITSALEQESFIANNHNHSHHTLAHGLHVIFNKLSKWIVAVTFGGFLLLRHDALALWAAMGSVLNVILSLTLKQIFKQERPHSEVKSGYRMPSSNDEYGMPSSHSQSIFFTLVFVILSVVSWQGLNGVTATLSLTVVALGCYFAWLRSLLRYHTTSQVIVGAVVGSVFSVLWFLAWESIVHKAYNSSLWARILVIVGGFCFSIGFFAHVIQHWLKEED